MHSQGLAALLAAFVAIVFVVGVICASSDSWAVSSKLSSVFSKTQSEDFKGDYAIYYGIDSERSVEVLSGYDSVVIEPKNFSRDNVQKLRDKGVKVLGYISVVEQNAEDIDFISLKDDWFYKPNGSRVKNEKWNSYYMDIRQKGYENFLVRQVYTYVVGKGLDGVMLDTAGDIDDSDWDGIVKMQMRDAYASFLSRVDSSYPQLYIVQNWGFETFKTHSCRFVDAVMWEGLSDFNVENDEWSRNWFEKFAGGGTDIYAVVPEGQTITPVPKGGSRIFVYKRDSDIYDSIK